MVFSKTLKFYKEKLAKIRNLDKELVKNLNFKDVKLLAHKKDYAKIEKQHNISIIVFGFEHETPDHLYISKQIFEKHVDFIEIEKFSLFLN